MGNLYFRNSQVNGAETAVDGTEGSWKRRSVAVQEPAREPVLGTGKREFRRGSGLGRGVAIYKHRVLGVTKCLQIGKR